MANTNWRNSKSAQQFTEQVSKRVIKQIGEDKAPWQKGWDKATSADQPPYNPVSGKRFKGLNSIQLRSVAEERGYSDPRWMTYNTANKIGAKIRKGERGTRVEYLRFPPKDESKTQGEAGDKAGKEQERPKITHQTYVVFNAEQVEKMPALELQQPKQPRQEETCERAERLLQASGANIEQKDSDWAYYNAGTDKIVLPEQKDFKSPEHYYSQAVHELGHWSGHESRMNREAMRPGASSEKDQAKEEMRGEMASMTVAGKLSLPKEPTYGRYNEAWTEAIKNDPGELRNAARDADKMADYVLQYDRQPERRPADVPREAGSVADTPQRQVAARQEPEKQPVAARQEPEKQPDRAPEVAMSR